MEAEFPGVIKKKQFPWFLVFGLRITKGVASSQEAQFSEQKFPIFYGISKGKVTKKHKVTLYKTQWRAKLHRL